MYGRDEVVTQLNGDPLPLYFYESEPFVSFFSGERKCRVTSYFI